MSTTVEINIDDDGNITVGIGDGPSDDVSNMQPAQNIAQALAMAKHLLATAPEAGGGSPNGSGAGQTGANGNGASGAQQAAGQQGSPWGSGAPNGKGGGTGPDSQGSTVTSVQDGDAGSGDAGGQSAQQLWNTLAQMNLPQD